jgi:hypothetical protein
VGRAVEQNKAMAQIVCETELEFQARVICLKSRGR